MKFCLDANIWIESWKTYYPIDVFPSFWRALCEHVNEIILIDAIDREIWSTLNDNGKDLRTWIDDEWISEKNEITRVEDAVHAEAREIGKTYKLGGKKRGIGASTSDTLLIAYAKISSSRGDIPYVVVTSEHEQRPLPNKTERYKIPTLCDKEDIRYMSLVSMLRQLNIEI